MILRYGVENYRSFRDPVEVSFVSSARRDEPAWRFSSAHARHGVLPVVGVWGANASGKSNLLSALLFLRALVRDSFVGYQPDQPVPWAPWRLDRGPEAPATRMDIDVVDESDARFHFGFRLDASGFVEEWLYRWEGAHRRLLYHRDQRETDPWRWGPTLRGERKAIATSTRPNALFLSAAAQFNHEQLLPVYEALASGIRDGREIALRGYPVFGRDSPLLDEVLRPAILQLLTVADLGIADFRIEEVPAPAPPPDEALAKVFQPELLEELRSKRREQEAKLRICLRHGTRESGLWDLPPGSESRGTMVLLARLEDVVERLRSGGMLVLDEIDTSLHPDLCKALVELFTDPRSNPRGAQLLFSTHDRDLLETLRTDEVLLVDKEADGASRVHAASDYKGVRTRDDLRRAHEQGRIRGVPVLGDLAGAVARTVSDAP
jgi:hypothetical protein